MPSLPSDVDLWASSPPSISKRLKLKTAIHAVQAAPVNAPEPRISTKRRLAALAILFVGGAIPASIAGLAVSRPVTRDIHIEAYRYGFSPSRITANRGDRLRLTFSTRDTGQSFFFQDYDLHVGITPGNRLVSVQRLSRPGDPPAAMEVVEIIAGLPGWRGWLVPKSEFRNHTYNGPLHGTERGALIVSPNFLLWGALGVLCALPFAVWLPRAETCAPRPINLFQRFPWLKRVVKAPSFQLNLALPMLGVFWFLILAGLFGTKVSGRNAGPMVVWVVWLSALILVLVPIGGRIWCTACPLPVFGEWLQRRRLARGRSGWVWPSRLSNAWPRVILFLLLGTFSTTLVALPPATSWMLIGLAAMAVLTAFFSEQRIFCRHLCPVNSYISLYSAAGRVMVRSGSSETCAECEEHFCLTGSAKGWGCPYGLCIGELQRNHDCGVCMECVKTCAYDNVAVYWRNSGWDREIAGYGEAWQAIVMFALACLYCYVNLGVWDRVRNWIDLVDKQRWDTFAVYAAAVWVGCLGVLPLVWYMLTRVGIAASKSHREPGAQFRASTAALVPIGLACWIAFALATVLSMTTFVLQSLSDPFNWGWNLLGMAGSRWHILWSPAIPWLQTASILVGAAFALKTLDRCWLDAAKDRHRAILGSLPLGSFLWIAAAGMICLFAA